MPVTARTADITDLEVDAIVNAANEHLAHGGGVAAAIARAGAPVVDEESAAWIQVHGPLRPGETAVTGAGPMPTRWVIHVVGPRYRAGQDNERLLTEAVTACLDRADSLGAATVALPAISAGVFGYPRPEATAVIAGAARRWIDTHPGSLDEIILVGYDDSTTAEFQSALDSRS